MRVAIVTLGCDKNTVDNEYLAGMLEGAGCEVVLAEDARPIDAAVVTTCGFIAAAKEQSIDAIGALARAKREKGSPGKLYVAGCLAQRQGEELMVTFPEIDGLVGVGQFRDLTEMIAQGDEKGSGERRMQVAPVPTVDIYQHLARRPLGSHPHAFLKVSDGCNHTCSFCAIPAMKGKLRSVEPEILLAEAREMLARGVREICLVAQDLSDYGRDRWPDYRLPELLREICALPGDFWVRCMYYYPGQVTDRFLEVLATEPKIVKYLEMPLQHLHPAVLRRMRRPFHEKNTFEQIARIRKAVPGIALRTTFIIGFPGETQEEFQFLLDGIQELEFDRLGAFQYSREDGTPAGGMHTQVNPQTKAQRWRMVMDRQAKIAGQLNRKRKGKTEQVLIEGFDEQSGFFAGRSTGDAPHVDGKVLIEAQEDLRPGTFATVRIARSTTYDVYGRVESLSASAPSLR